MKYLALSILIFCSLQASNCRAPGVQSEKIALIAAIKKGKLEKVRACLRAGANPNMPDKYGTMPLHWASCYDRQGDIIKALLQEDAKIDGTDKEGWISLDWAHEASNASAIKQLIQKAIDSNNLTIRGYKGKTLLHYAAALDDVKESYNLVEKLLKLQLDPNVQDMDGYTALDYVVSKQGNQDNQLILLLLYGRVASKL